MSGHCTSQTLNDDENAIIIALPLGAVVLAAFYLAYVLTDYIRDPKRLRRFQALHPFSGLTALPWIWMSMRLKRFLVLHKVHKDTGAAIIRVAPNILSFNDPRAAADIYGHGTKAVKDDYYDAGFTPGQDFKNLADIRDKSEHSGKRRIVASGYALNSVVRWEGKIASRVQALIDQYDRSIAEGRPIDHRHWMNLFTIDAINDIGISANTRLLEKGDDLFTVQDANTGREYQCRYKESLWNGHTIHTTIAWLPERYNTFRSLTWWDSRWKDGDAYNDIVRSQVKRRRQREEGGEEVDDFFSYLLKNRSREKHQIPLGEITAECNVMLNAGSDTTSIALTNCLYHLMKNPSCMAKLREEIDAALSSSTETVAPYDLVKNLPYLKACLDESLRLNPPSATTTPRRTPPQGQEITGE